MCRKILSTPLFVLLTLFFSFSSVSGQSVIKFGSLRSSDQEDQVLKQHFSEYTLGTLNTKDLAKLLRSREYTDDLRLEVEGQIYSFNLRARDLRAPHYKLRVFDGEKSYELPRSPNKTYYGFTHKGHRDVRITLDSEYFAAMLLLEEDELYIEPLYHHIQGSPKDQFVIYWGSHTVRKFTLDNCGVHDGPVIHHDHDHADEPEEEGSDDRRRACKVLEIALANDLLMFNKYGSVTAVENHNMTVINNVETNYDFEFNDDLQFSIVEIYVAINAQTDPWTSSTDPGALLNDFTGWGPNGFSNVHDIASLWTARNFNGSTIGLAWLNSVCGSLRYHVLEDFSNNQQLLRVLQAHEMGHNFNANHDAEGSNFIMAPSVSNTNNWSTASINAINAKINQISCLAPCGSSAPPIANFSGNPISGCAPMTVNFTDLSQNTPTSWSWTFEGGTPATSTQKNPTVTYNAGGSFNVTLTATNSQGSSTLTKTDYINVGDDPIADFSYTVNGLTVNFTNLSQGGTSYHWNFGDGSTSTQINPSHTYDEDGSYSVILTAINACGSDVYSQFLQIITLPWAYFVADQTSGCDPFEVLFINLSSNNSNFYSWSFPGGIPTTSTAFQPIVLYETPGIYNASLTVYNNAGEDTYTIQNYITVNAQPESNWTYTTNGLTVNFNSSSSTGDSYFWNFGDGNVSVQQNPVHTYASSGTYYVTLNVSNDCGTDVLQLGINVTGAPSAQFTSNLQYGCAPLIVQFTNQSGGNPTQFSWAFEGGSPATSNLPNPLVTYNTPGVYDVQLTVSNSTGTDVLLLENYIEVASSPVSSFSFNVDDALVSFLNQSAYSSAYHWDFGDGQTSTQIDPAHVYGLDGIYTVTLIVTGACGMDTSTAQVNIQTPPQAGFSFQIISDCVPASVQFTNECSANATAFQWSFPGGSPSSSSLENPTVTYTVASTYDVSLIAISPGGSDTMIWPAYVTIGAAPDANFLIANTDMSVSLTNQSIGADQYFWSFGDGQTSTEINPVHEYADHGTYQLSLIASNACGNDTMTVTIVLSDSPHAFFTYTAHSGCAPFEIQFLDQSQNNPTSWQWNFENGIPSTSTLQNPVIHYEIPGSHTVSLQVTNDAGTDVLVLDGLVQVGGTPDASFLMTAADTMVFLEYTGTDYDSLRWFFGNGLTDNSLNPTAIYTTSGLYEITLIAYNPCGSDTSSVWVNITISNIGDDGLKESAWQIKPNPFSDRLLIYGEPLHEGKIVISLLDVNGRVISREEWSHGTGVAVKEYQGHLLSPGMILVLIQNETSRLVLKAVHQDAK